MKNWEVIFETPEPLNPSNRYEMPSTLLVKWTIPWKLLGMARPFQLDNETWTFIDTQAKVLWDTPHRHWHRCFPKIIIRPPKRHTYTVSTNMSPKEDHSKRSSSLRTITNNPFWKMYIPSLESLELTNSPATKLWLTIFLLGRPIFGGHRMHAAAPGCLVLVLLVLMPSWPQGRYLWQVPWYQDPFAPGKRWPSDLVSKAKSFSINLLVDGKPGKPLSKLVQNYWVMFFWISDGLMKQFVGKVLTLYLGRCILFDELYFSTGWKRSTSYHPASLYLNSVEFQCGCFQE